MIDIIIPAYRAHSTLHLTLSSILIQSFADRVKVTIINDDPDGESYRDFVEHYSRFFRIEEIVCKENVGPGFSRQLGIERTVEKYLAFIDADDVFSDALAIQKMIELLEANPSAVMASCTFLECNQDATYIRHDADVVWMFGKVYRREYLNSRKIRFINSWSNEDLGFNLQIKLRLKENEYIHFHNEPVYLWRFKEDSITRVDNGNYSFHKAPLGVIENKLKILKAEGPEKSRVQTEIIAGLIDFYFMLQTTRIHRPNNPEFAEEILERIVEYYNELGKSALGQVSKEQFSEIYKARERISTIVPIFTFHSFINMIEGES